MKISNTYSIPKEIKTCEICGKEIDKKWRDNICLSCRDKLNLNPEKLKEINEIFKIHNHEK